MGNDLEIKEISKNLFDVFWEQGWSNWARIQNNNGFLKQIAGVDIPKSVFSALIQMYSKKGT